MVRCCWAVTIQATLLLVSTAAIAAPAQIRGKSVIVTWTESRVQRDVRREAFRTFPARIEMFTYISSNGRVFSRLQTRGTNDQVAGERGTTRTPSFQGNRMTVVQRFEGLARQTNVEFEANFTACTASVILGKQSGAASGYLRGMGGSGPAREIQSATAGSASCSIRSSNVFQ
jgi:hypothetical protein